MSRIVAAVLVALALSSAVSAAPQGRITARLQSNASGVVAGRPWTVTVAVRNGSRPFAGKISLLAKGEAYRRSFRARLTRPGRFRARVTFPGGGTWTLTVRAGRGVAPLPSVDVRGAGPPISRPHGFELAEEHGDLVVPDLDGTGFYEVNLRTHARRLVGTGFAHPSFSTSGPAATST
ncbi:MAG: hypothetical protein ACRDON_08395, partial [Gaiellaceae bacterium]